MNNTSINVSELFKPLNLLNDFYGKKPRRKISLKEKRFNRYVKLGQYDKDINNLAGVSNLFRKNKNDVPINIREFIDNFYMQQYEKRRKLINKLTNKQIKQYNLNHHSKFHIRKELDK